MTVMINVLYWALALLMFGILVMLHEFGHFVMARMTGVTVMEFAVGFGPKILSRKAKSGIVYSWRALPFGGYCRFVGEDDGDVDREDAYAKAKIWKRALISFGGPLMNVVTAIVLLIVVFFAIGVPVGAEPVIDAFLTGLPAESSGLAIGDRIIEIDGTAVTSTNDAAALIAAADGNVVSFTVEREGKALTFEIQPAWTEDEDGARYMIGIQYLAGTRPVRFGFVDSVKSAFSLTGQMSVMIVDVLKTLLTTGEGVENVSGPLGTMTLIKEETQSGGLFSYLYLASMISVNLAVFNMLPIPGLDGSKFVFLAIEKIRRKPLDPNKEGLVTLIGFSLLIGIMVLVLYQDIMRLIQ